MTGSLVPHLNWRELFTLTDVPDAAPEIGILDTYFTPFAAVQITTHPDGTRTGRTICVECGDDQTQDIVTLLLGRGFEWGLKYGEGHCKRCRWPARAYHTVKDPAGKQLFTGTIVLQYHPDYVTRKQP